MYKVWLGNLITVSCVSSSFHQLWYRITSDLNKQLATMCLIGWNESNWQYCREQKWSRFIYSKCVCYKNQNILIIKYKSIIKSYDMEWASHFCTSRRSENYRLSREQQFANNLFCEKHFECVQLMKIQDSIFNAYNSSFCQ